MPFGYSEAGTSGGAADGAVAKTPETAAMKRTKRILKGLDIATLWAVVRVHLDAQVPESQRKIAKALRIREPLMPPASSTRSVRVKCTMTKLPALSEI